MQSRPWRLRQNDFLVQQPWIKEHTLAADNTVVRPTPESSSRSLINQKLGMGGIAGSNVDQVQRCWKRCKTRSREKSFKLDRSDLVESSEHWAQVVWCATHGSRVKIKLVPPSTWIVNVPEKLDLFHDKYFPSRWKIRKECNVCDTASAFKSFNHPGIAPPLPTSCYFPFFSGRHLPHSPLAMMLSPPLRYHMISRDQLIEKSWSCWTTVGLVGGCSRSDVVWGTGEVGARPTQQPTPAFQWENSCSPSQLTIYFKLYQSKPTRFILIFMILYIIYLTIKTIDFACPPSPSSQSISNHINQNQPDGALCLCLCTMYIYSYLFTWSLSTFAHISI